MSSKQELNKKLAEWRGFKYELIVIGDGGSDVGRWTYPDGSICINSPNLTQSLDALFEWIVPKALREIATIHNVRIQKAFEILLRFWSDKRAEVDEPDADALALCLAVEKLIDSEVLA